MNRSILLMMNGFLAARLDAKALAFLTNTQAEIGAGVADARFSALVSLSSRYIPKRPLALTAEELADAQREVKGWSPCDWSLLEAARVSLVLTRPDVSADGFAEKFNHLFIYADEGESCAYYRSLPLLPEPKRFVWRAAEGCRTNMRTVFMAVACDSPYPCLHFDDVAWNQMVVKALFTETPLTRIYGLDQRLSSTLAIMVLDYMDERRSAGRTLPVDAWLCLGSYHDERVAQAVALAWASGQLAQQAGALFALARSKRNDSLMALQQNNTVPRLVPIFEQVLAGKVSQQDFETIISNVDN